MNNTPKVSIVLPCYNGAQLLGQAIESCINQTFKDWELIIVNDCSTDNTLEVANAYAQQDERIRVYTNEKNSKLPATLNNGFRRAQGKYWTWTSDDNLLHPDMLETFVTYLDAHQDVGFLASDEQFIDMEGNVFGVRHLPDDLDLRLPLNCHIGASFMYRSEVAKKIGEYREDLFLVEDFEYFLRLSDNCKLVRIPKVLYSYRDNPGSLTATRQKEIAECLVKFRLMYLPQAEKRLMNHPNMLALYYYRIVDNLTGCNRIKHYFKFACKMPFRFGLKYIFVHLPNRMLKRMKGQRIK